MYCTAPNMHAPNFEAHRVRAAVADLVPTMSVAISEGIARGMTLADALDYARDLIEPTVLRSGIGWDIVRRAEDAALAARGA